MRCHFQFQLSLRDSNGKVEKEEVESDVTDDVVRYDLKSDGGRHVVIQDFGKVLSTATSSKLKVIIIIRQRCRRVILSLAPIVN